MTTERRRRRVRVGFRARVLGLVAILVVCAGGLGLLTQRAVLLRRLDQEVARSLEQERQEIENLTAGRNPATGEPFGDDVAAIFDTFLARNVPGEGEVYLTFVDDRPYKSTVAPEGVRLDLDQPLVKRWVALDSGENGRIDTSAGPVTYLAVPLRFDGETLGVFVVANFERSERDEIESGIRVEALVSVVVLMGALVAAWLLAGRLLRPLREVTETARTIGETDLSRRIPVDSDDEIGELARTFNGMLDRLDLAFSTQRAFVDDAGHELRTPITVVRGHLEVMGDDPDERRETIALVTDELDRMTRIVDDLLVLAKAEQPNFIRLEPEELCDFTTDILSKARALGDRRWVLDSAADGVAPLDRDRMTQALLNLARNAAEHTEPGDEIGIGSERDDDGVRFWVRDTGPGVDPADRHTIFRRFHRSGDRPRSSEGAGLGLAIVEAIAMGHGATVRVDDVDPHGANFVVSLPPTESTDDHREEQST